jgi:light-regulated signal transduction histidine kinase (bacteriophytochrome)
VSAITDLKNSQLQECHMALLQEFQVKANLVVPILQQEQLWGLLIAHQCSGPRQWTSFETELLLQLANQIGIALAQARLLKQETQQRQELARSNAELQEFAYVASHDLQEPLRKIQAFGDRLQSKCGDALTEQGRDYLERMQGAARRMQGLIEDLLTLSRVTTQAQPFVPTDLNQVVQEVLSDLEVRLRQAGGGVEVGELPILDADPGQMRRLCQNLIGNALKFHQDGEPPAIRIYSSRLQSAATGMDSPDRWQIFIEDNGIGFDEKYLDRIFNPFQRLHGRGEFEGTGMGLAICRKIVERHGGTLGARSTPGEGTTFIATLPANQPQGDHAE